MNKDQALWKAFNYADYLWSEWGIKGDVLYSEENQAVIIRCDDGNEFAFTVTEF